MVNFQCDCFDEDGCFEMCCFDLAGGVRLNRVIGYW